MLKEMDGHGDAMRDLALSQDGQLIASSDDSGYVTTWHGGTGRPLAQAFRAHQSPCSLDFSPDSTTLATGSSDYTVKLWSTETWQQQGELLSCHYDVNYIRYSPSGELLAIATSYNIKIYNSSAKGFTANLGASATSLMWTPDGKRLLSGNCDDIIIREWDSSTWKQAGDIWKGRTGYPWRVGAANYNGTLVASPTTDNCVRIWRLTDWQTIAIFQHSDVPCCVTFSMDGRQILVGGKDKKISEWAVPEHAWPKDVLKDEMIYQVCLCSFFIDSSSYLFVPRFKTAIQNPWAPIPRFRALPLRLNTLIPRYASTPKSYNTMRACRCRSSL